MKFILTLCSFPGLIWAYFQYPFLNQFDWEWLFLAFFIYCFLLLRLLVKVLESPGQYGFNGKSSGGGSGGFISGDSGGDCGGGGDS